MNFFNFTLQLSDGRLIAVTLNDSTNDANAVVVSAAIGSVINVGNMNDFSIASILGATGLTDSDFNARNTSLQTAVASALGAGVVIVDIPNNVIIVSPSS